MSKKKKDEEKKWRDPALPTKAETMRAYAKPTKSSTTTKNSPQSPQKVSQGTSNKGTTTNYSGRGSRGDRDSSAKTGNITSSRGNQNTTNFRTFSSRRENQRNDRRYSPTRRNDRRTSTTRPTTQYSRNTASKTKDTKVERVFRGAANQWAGGQLSSIGTSLQSAETTARSYRNAKYEGDDRNYSLRSRQEAERTNASRTKNIGLKEGINTRKAERTYEYDPNGLSQKLIRKGDKLIESGTKDIEKAKEGTGKVGSLAIDIGSNAVQMAGDSIFRAIPVVGQAMGMASLMNRAGGTASYEARQLGMNPDQQATYQQGTALIEGLSEGIFNSVSAFRATYGKGAFSLADRVSTSKAANQIVQNLFKSDLGQSLAINMARLGTEMFEEGFEELVADIAEPALKYTLMKSTDPKYQFEGYDPKTMAYDFLVGALMAGMPGAVDVGRSVRADVTSKAYSDGQAYATELINRGMAQGRMTEEGTEAKKSDAEILARNLQEQQAQGLKVLPANMKILERAVNESSEANARAFENRSAENEQRALQEERLAPSTNTLAEETAYNKGENAVEDRNTQAVKERMGENISEKSARAVGRVLTGTATNDDIETILINPEARRATEELALNKGETLSVNTAKARDTLENVISMNEIANKDAIRREVQTAHANEIAEEINMSKRGGKLFAENYAEAVEAIGSPEVYEEVFTRLYTDGTIKGSDFEDSYERIVAPLGNRVTGYFTKDVALKAYQAGQMASIVEAGKTSVKEKAIRDMGAGITVDDDATGYVSERVQKDLAKFAQRANVHIHIVKTMSKTLKDGTKLSANGRYHNGVIYIAADADNKLITVAKHELTHHIKKFSPERYKELEDFVFEKWYKSNKEAMEDAIRRKQLLYRDISVEEAKEEIIADASEAFFTDETAVQEAVTFSEKLGRAIRDGIHALLDTFTSLDSSQKYAKDGEEGYRYRGYGEFLKELDILRDAEKMWINALEGTMGENAETISESELEAIEGKNLYSIKDGNARWTDDRIDQLIEEYGASHDDRYSKAYAVMMNPREFLKLTLSDESLGKWNESAKNMPDKLKGKPYRENVKNVHDERLETGVWIHDNENYPIDYEELARQKQTPFLEISSDNGTMVDGHEGRHRMRALMEAGVESVPVVIRDTDTKYTKDHVLSMALSSQDFGRGAVNNGARVILHNLIPIKQSNRDELIEKFGGEADVKFSVKEDQAYMDAVNKGDMETAQKLVIDYGKAKGYDSQLYHGTRDFGFTKIRTSDLESNSDGGYYEWSPFFATDSMEVAQTYSAKDSVKRVNEGAEPFDEEQFDYDFNDALGDLVDSFNRFAGYYNFMDYGDNLFEKAYKKLQNTSEPVDDIIGELEEYTDNLIMDIAWDKANSEGVEDVDSYADELQESDEADTIYVKLNIVSDMLRAYDSAMYGDTYSGNYDLLANTDNMMQVDAEGNRWNYIPYKGDHYRTRDLAQIARDEGYDGIKISNVFDDGGKGMGKKQTKSASVYIFFKPENQVKSADPVTYDDNGKVIPLSERFKESNEDIRYSVKDSDKEYMKAVKSKDMATAERLVRDAAYRAGYTTEGYHGSLNASFTIFDKRKSTVAGNSGAGFYFSSNEEDSKLNYEDAEGADNQTKIDAFFDMLLEEGEWDGEEIENAEQAYAIAKKALSKNPGTYHVFLKYNNPYVRDYDNSTNIFYDIMDGFDESVVDRNDFDTDDDYQEALMQERDEYFYNEVDNAVRGAISDLEDFYDYVSIRTDVDAIVRHIAEDAFDYERLNWDDINEYLNALGDIEIMSDNDADMGWGAPELSRAIIERFGYDAIEDKEAGTKFRQLEEKGMTDTEHIIVFKPNQIKSADAVTYDSEGNIIPISQRFNLENDDIRFSVKEKQFDIIQKANPMLDGYHTGIRDVSDIKDAWEVFKEKGFVSSPDWTFEDAQKALDNGKVTVFSSKPIADGTFVTPSMMEAESYAGEGSFYQAEVPLEDIAWVDSIEGQYAKVSGEETDSEAKFSIKLMNYPAPKPAIDKGGKEVGSRVIRNRDGSPMLMSGFEVTADTLRMMGKESEIPTTRIFLNAMAKMMEKMGEKYTYIGLNDVMNADLEVRRDKDGNPVSIVVSAMVKNGEYPINFDFSSICKKRQAMSKLFEKLSTGENGDFLDSVELTVDNLWEINEILSKNGFETACLGCFVETKRYGIENWADTFVEKWNKAVRESNPNATYFSFSTKTDIDYGYVSDEIEKFAENKKSERNKESQRRKRERSNWKKKWMKDNPSGTEADAEKAFKDWWKKKYNKKAADYKESWFETPALSNDKAILSLVNSGKKMQKLLRKTDLISPKGLKALMALHPDFYGVLYGHFGSGTPKPMVSFTPYNSELALLDRQLNPNGGLKKYTTEANEKMVNKLKSIGGVRVQSFSDFLIQNTFDYIQMVCDMSARNFPAHAYTKEIAFAKIFGLTGMKINLSVMFDVDPEGIAPGLDKYGNYVVADKARQEREKANGKHVFSFSISFDEARELQNKEGYDGNIGIIGVGLSDMHIRKMLNDPDIKMVIPYHSSSMPTIIKQRTGLGADSDYTSTQNTLNITKITRDGKDVTKQYGKEYMLDLYKKKGSWKEAFRQFRKDTEGCEITTEKAFESIGDFPLYTGDSAMSLDATNDPKLTAEYYMGWCIEQGHFPLFYQFADEENYFKVLYDFNVYKSDGTYAPQNAVTNTYPEELESIVDQYMNEANDFEKEQMPRWDKTIDETKEMLKRNSYNGEGSFSLKESSYTPTAQTTIAKLEEKVADLKSEFKRTNLKSADPKQVRVEAGRLIRRHDSNLAIQPKVVKAMNDIFTLYKEKGDDAFKEAEQIAKETAKEIVDKMYYIQQENEAAKETMDNIKTFLRNNPVVVTERMKRSITDWGDFYRKNFGRIKMGKGLETNIDQTYWARLAKFDPEYFTPDYAEPASMLEHIADYFDEYSYMHQDYEMSTEEMQDYVVEIASDIMWTAYDLRTKKTFADKKYLEKEAAVKKAREEALASRKKALGEQKKRYEKKIDFLKQKHQDYKAETKENAEKKRRIKQISNVYKRLYEKLFTPSDTKHLPNDYAPVVSNVLKMFDFTTPGMEKWAERHGEPSRRYKYMTELRKQLEEMSKNEGSELEVDPNLIDLVDEIMADMGDGQRLIDMDSKTLEDISVLFRAFEHQVNSYNKAFDEANKKAISDTAHSIFDNLNETKKSKWKLGIMGRFLTSNFNPSDFFELVGGDIADLYNATRLGFDKYVDRLDNAKTFLQDRVDNKKADKWANHVETYKTSDGEEIQLTDTQLMSLYCLNKREQAQGHIYVGGIVSAPLKVKGKLTTKELEKTRVIPSIEDVGRWFETLTDEQKEIADSIQKYFVDEVSEWGNETSMKLYNYKKFGEQNYFPIQSSSDYMASNFDMRGNDPVLKNMGMTKALTKKASNAIVVDDIFTVYSKHVAQMASYNAYVPAITDFQRVWNYTEGNDQDMVKARFEAVYGKKAADYIDNFFKNLNGVYKANFDPTILDKGLGLFKKAAVGGNIRVLVQQPTAIARASLIINPAYLTAAVPLATARPKATYKEMMDHCPIARWKTWGFYSSDITSASRDLKNIMIGKEALTDKIFMDMYGTADNVTWTVIFKACELQVEAQNKGLKKGSDEYWEKVNELASRVFDRTQVVDSPFHRSEIMKSQNGITKMATAFMAEPTKTINMINTELTKAMTELKNGHPAKATGIFVRVAMVITANAAALAVAQAMVDAMRHAGGDDDKDKGDYKDRFKNYWKSNFTDNLNPLGMIPYIKDVKSIWDGYDVVRMDMTGVTKLINSIRYLQKYYENPEESKYSAQEEWTNLALQTFYAAGIPVANAKRDIEGLYVTIMEGTGHPEVFFKQAKMKYQVNYKTKSMFADMYYDALARRDNATAREIYNYLLRNGVTADYIKKRKATYDKHKKAESGK